MLFYDVSTHRMRPEKNRVFFSSLQESLGKNIFSLFLSFIFHPRKTAVLVGECFQLIFVICFSHSVDEYFRYYKLKTKSQAPSIIPPSRYVLTLLPLHCLPWQWIVQTARLLSGVFQQTLLLREVIALFQIKIKPVAKLFPSG